MIDPNYPNDRTELGGSGLIWMTPSHPRFKNVSIRKSDADDPDEVVLKTYCIQQKIHYELIRAILKDQGLLKAHGSTYDPDLIDTLYEEYGPPDDLLTYTEASALVNVRILKTIPPAWTAYGIAFYRESDIRYRDLDKKPRDYSVQRAMMSQQYHKHEYQKAYPITK